MPPHSAYTGGAWQQRTYADILPHTSYTDANRLLRKSVVISNAYMVWFKSSGN